MAICSKVKLFVAPLLEEKEVEVFTEIEDHLRLEIYNIIGLCASLLENIHGCLCPGSAV